MSNNRRRTRMVIAAAVISLGIGTTVTYALLPSTSVPPAAVPLPRRIHSRLPGT